MSSLPLRKSLGCSECDPRLIIKHTQTGIQFGLTDTENERYFARVKGKRCLYCGTNFDELRNEIEKQ